MVTIIHEEDHELEKITEVYVFVECNETGEGIIGKNLPTPFGMEMFMPFVCSSKETLGLLKQQAKDMAKSHNKKIKMIRLSNREEIEEYNHAH